MDSQRGIDISILLTTLLENRQRGIPGSNPASVDAGRADRRSIPVQRYRAGREGSSVDSSPGGEGVVGVVPVPREETREDGAFLKGGWRHVRGGEGHVAEGCDGGEGRRGCS
jgi:hypothetical protein